MPLSEHEQRLLEQMERALYAEDPKFASALDGSGIQRRTRRRALLAVAGFVIGIALLMTGVASKLVWVSVVGFLVMLGCTLLAITGWRSVPASAEQQQQSTERPRPPRTKRHTRVMDRIEERWQRRQDDRHQP